jgi:surface antigen
MMRLNRFWIGLLATALGAAPAANHALAQSGAFGWSPDTARLTDEDNRLLWENTVALNNAPTRAAGESRSWTNPTSGNSGKVTIARLYDASGMPCHALHYAISFASQPVPQDYEFNWCRVASGQWKIAP